MVFLQHLLCLSVYAVFLERKYRKGWRFRGLRVLGNEGGCGFNIVLGDISLTPPMSRHRPGVVPFSQTVTDCQPFGASQEAVLVSAICQVVLSPTNAVFLPWDGAEERRGALERSCHLFSSLSLSFLCYRRKRGHLSFWIFSWWRLSWRTLHLSRECHSSKTETAPTGQNEFIHAVNPTVPLALLSGADTLHTDTHTRAHTSMSVWISEG